MKFLSRILVLALMVALSLTTTALAKDGKSQRTYRKITLKNGLKVILASDPDINVSSASMAVGVGAIADPKDVAGLAHFLEHMLFLANKKYPKLNSYGEFLRSRGGYSNAYTAGDHTNYHFQVNHDGFAEALDRFSQFFISPTLDYRYAQRESLAVHSEHMKNVMQDNWRLVQLQRSSIKKDHPANGFYTGNKQTLENADEKQLRKFFDDYYGPENMALSVISPLPLDQLERLVRERFAAIPKRKVKEFTASADILDEVDTLRMFKVKPIKDIRQLKLYFAVPPQHGNITSKNSRLIGMTMGDEGQGSLLSYLKKQGLATSCSAGLSNDTRYYSSCRVTIGLTKKGMKEWKKVLQLSFGYINMLKQNKFPTHIWKEMKTMAELRRKYSPRPEGTDAAISYANNALNYGLKVAEKVDYLYVKPDPKNYREILTALRPSNALVFLVGKGVKTDKKEKWYGTSYAYTETKGELYDSLKEIEPPKGLHLPKPNPFIPESTNVLAERPVLAVKNSRMTLWYHQDQEFNRPKVAVYFHILTPNAYSSARQAILNQLYVTLIKEKLNEYSYPALVAGLGFSLSATKKGVMVTVSGYSDSAFKLLEMVGGELGKADFDEKTFDSVKERLIRGFKNYPLGQAYTLTRQINRKMVLKNYYLPGEIMKALQPLTLEDVKQYADSAFARAHLQGLCAGNLTKERAVKTAKKLYANLGALPMAPHKAHEDKILWLEKGDDLVYKETLITNNACLRMDYQVGVSDMKTRLAAQVVARALQNAFYTEMRTRQKLGYIVWSGTFNRKKVQYIVFIIQSGTNDAPDLFQRADKFLGQVPTMMKGLPDQAFNAIRNSLIKDRQKKAKSIAAKGGQFYDLAFDKKGQFDYVQREIEILKKLKKAEVIELLNRTLAKETRRRMTILLNAKQHEKFKKPGNVTDLEKFSQGRVYYNK